MVVVPNPLWIARLTEPAYTIIEDGTTYEVEIEVAAASPDMPAPSMRPDGKNPVEVYIATSSRTAFADIDYEAFGRNLPIPTSSFMAGPDGVQRGRATFTFSALQDSEPEGAETLWFFLERATIVAIDTITFEGPDGRRDTNSVRYPATIVDANTPASGAPAIAGTGRAGETLRATTDAVSDLDGLGEFTYRWVRIDGGVETEIGTGAATYLPVADDVGKRIRVEVAFADALGFAEGPFASDSVAIRAAAPPAVCPVLDLAGTGRSALAPIRVGVGEIQVFKVPVAYGYYAGDALLSAGGTIGGGSFALGGTAYAVEGAWAGTGGSLVFNLDGAVSAAERAALALHVCGESYAFADAEHDPSTDAYTWQRAGLDWSGAEQRELRLSTTRSLPTGAPEIEGTARIGETLEAATDAIADADGLSAPGFAYQWLRVEGVEETEISGADARTYTVTAEDLGKAVRVRVRFTDDRSFAEEATSAALPIVNTPATGTPEIRGSGRVGGTLRATTDAVADADGLGNAAFSYRWVRLDGAEETEVGTDSDSYSVVAADEGKRIRVEVTFTDDLGAAEGPLASIPATVLDASPPLSSSCGTPDLAAGRVPIWNSRVTLSSLSGGIGFHHEQSGQRLQDPDFVIASAPAYTFLSALNFVGGSRNGGLRFELDRALAPSHAASLVLHDCDDSFAFADAAYSASDLTYSWPAAGADWRGLPLMRELRLSVPGNNPATGAPGIAGTARVGETLTALTGGIGDADGLSGASFAYRWLRVEGETATAISGATAGTYTLADDDEGNRVKVEVAFTDDLGSPEGPLESAPFPAAGTIAMPVPPMTDPSDLLSATLTVKDKNGDLGCFATGSGVLCGSSSVMTDNNFTVGTVDYYISQLFLRTDGSVLLEFGETVRRDVTGSWTLTLGTTELVFSDAARNGGIYTWTGTGLSWTAGETVAVTVTDRGTGDVTPPEIVIARTIGEGGGLIVLQFGEGLDHDNRPSASAFTVTADGRPLTVTVSSAESGGRFIYLYVSPRLREGQTVTLTYTDPSDADDARAVQDAAGNDAASFTAAVRNDSAYTGVPDRPTGLEATANGPTRIDLAWHAPAEHGVSDITGYRIEFSPDGRLGLARPDGGHGRAGGGVQRHPCRPGRDPPLPGLGDQRAGRRRAVGAGGRDDGVGAAEDRGAAAGGRDAEGRDRRHRGPRRRRPRDVRVPVDPDRRAERDGDLRRDRGDLHAGRGRRGPAGPGAGELYRRREQSRGAGERGVPRARDGAPEHPGDRPAGDRGDGPGGRHAEGADRCHRRRRRAEQRRIQLPVGAHRRAGDPGRDRDRGDLHRGRSRPRQADPGRGRIHRRPQVARRAARERPGDGPGDERARVVPPARVRGPSPDLERHGDGRAGGVLHERRGARRRAWVRRGGRRASRGRRAVGPGLRARRQPLHREPGLRGERRGSPVLPRPRARRGRRGGARAACVRRDLRLRRRGLA